MGEVLRLLLLLAVLDRLDRAAARRG